MKYRIQATVSEERLMAIVDAVFKGSTFDPELKVYSTARSARNERRAKGVASDGQIRQ